MALVEICDLCEMNGQRRFAVARYWDETGKEWQICILHLGTVKQVGLKYEEYEKEQ